MLKNDPCVCVIKTLSTLNIQTTCIETENNYCFITNISTYKQGFDSKVKLEMEPFRQRNSQGFPCKCFGKLVPRSVTVETCYRFLIS